MPLSESESPSEEGTSSGLDLGDSKNVKCKERPTHAIGSNNSAQFSPIINPDCSLTWFMKLNLWCLHVFESGFCNKYLLPLNSVTLELFPYYLLKGAAAIKLRINVILQATLKLQLENKRHFLMILEHYKILWA